MNTKYEPSGFDPRIEALARRAGADRSLYLGEAIGNALAIAWNALGSLGSLAARSQPKAAVKPARA